MNFSNLNDQFIIARQSPCTCISQQLPLSLRSFIAWCCLRARHCCSINYKIWTDGNCHVSIPHTCVNGVFFEGGSRSRVVGAMGINCCSTWFCCRCSNFIWLTDCVSNVDEGLPIPNFSTWEVFLEYWVPLGVSIMTLLPVLLTTWDYIGLNGVENLSFCLSLALDHQIEYQIVWCF